MMRATSVVHTPFGVLRKEYDVIDWPGPEHVIQNVQRYLNDEPISAEQEQELITKVWEQQQREAG